ncbi:hypothetical protein CERSUDRAFT_109847 [Gelatoporia subvermispora B]|uniref:Uncharacterized protein n=1 Tax=Ceriporiopsis subvermispora (strain B) TaxID=914234 RepID=M2RS15_CERS8|nr:hypothetical protein CERSUDRAFT_109847 [Gelatoporia subvermispora B]
MNLRLRAILISSAGLSLRPHTRSALSSLQTITALLLSRAHSLSFSEFARMVCALQTLCKVALFEVTINGSRSYNLKNVRFARALHIKELYVQYCAFGDRHPFWNLLTAPSLSKSLESI